MRQNKNFTVLNRGRNNNVVKSVTKKQKYNS